MKDSTLKNCNIVLGGGWMIAAGKCCHMANIANHSGGGIYIRGLEGIEQFLIVII